jgi:hypothetical protein
MASVVGRPKIVVRIDAQTMRVSEESLADTLNKISLLVIFGKHWLGPLEEKYMSLRIDCDASGLAGNHPLGKLEKIRHHTIRKFRNRLEWSRLY